MQCRNTKVRPDSQRQQGLTLLEILVVLGIFTIVGSFALVVSLDTFRDTSYHADREALIASLEHARAEAVDDICDGASCATGSPHGVSIQADRYVIFQGSSYVARDMGEDEIIDANPAITHSGLAEVVFATSSGDVVNPGDIVLIDTSGRISTTTIGSYGQISWSN
jgi:prepilin-type N-terminal cleavage/methylation domain-containing protein